MYIDFIIISYLINYGLVYSTKWNKLNLFADAECEDFNLLRCMSASCSFC